MKAIIFIATVFLTLKCALSQSRYDEYDQYTPSDDRRHTVEVGDYYNQYQPRYSHPDSNYGYDKEIDCGPLPDIKNGKVEIVPDTKKASIATYFCDDGFLLLGKKQRVCTSRGRWSGKQPKCVPVNCGYLPRIANGRLILSGTHYRDTATYLCKRGFDLIGDRVRKCQGNGQWSTREPRCKRISCPKLEPPRYGTVYVTGRYPSDIAVYKCAYGYRLDGLRQRECLRTGEWSGTDPMCKEDEPIQDKKSSYGDDYGYYHDDY